MKYAVRLFSLALYALSLCMVSAGSAAQSSELPDHPQPQSTIPAMTATSSAVTVARRSMEPTAFNRTFVLWTAASFAMTVADIESTRHSIESCGLREANPLFGSNPSRAKLYAINLPITTAQNVLAWYVRKKNPNSRWWVLLPATNTAVHAAGFVNNVARCH